MEEVQVESIDPVLCRFVIMVVVSGVTLESLRRIMKGIIDLKLSMLVVVDDCDVVSMIGLNVVAVCELMGTLDFSFFYAIISSRA